MAGIYIHIPFCRKACNYCNFHFSTTLKNKSLILEAINEEIIQNRIPEKAHKIIEPIETIYFGGGTPSLLTEKELNRFIESIYKKFDVKTGVEITLETNPDDHQVENLHIWKSAGINRLSIGVQSFFDQDLTWMNRAHNAKQSINCIKSAQDKGFHNITIDLIYGTPCLTDEGWQQNLEVAYQLGIPHISCYALTVESKTALEYAISKNKCAPVNPEQQARQFLLLMKWARNNGFRHYEISNFAQPGYESKHNSSYWQQRPYLGFGPSAHSFDGDRTRWWNVANNNLYQRGIENGQQIYEVEYLTGTQKHNEYVMLALRTDEGIEKNVYEKNSLYHFEELTLKAAKWEKQGKLKCNTTHICLTDEGKIFADAIAADLFLNS